MKRFLSVLLALLLLALPVKTAAVTDLSANYSDASFEVVSDDNISLAASSNPVGHVERVNHLGVAGWAWMSSSPNTPINVHIYITNSSGFKRIYGTTANIFRQDLYNAGYGNGYHGFSYDIDWRTIPPGTYNVTVYGIGGNNPAITNPYSTYTVRYCAGVVEDVTSDSIAGWAWKPDEPNSSINVHLYVKRSNGEQVDLIGEVAYIYRSDLYNAGYGDGCHGFDIEMDWSQYPEERLSLYLYFVDGSGYHNCFWTGYYDNRRPINIIGMKDDIGVKFITTYTAPANTWCENIGCTAINRFTGATKGAIINKIREASFCVVNSHGLPKTIFCYLGGVEQETNLTSCDIDALADGYFNGTRCVLVAACWCGQGGAANPENIVNRLHQKGVETVVGFETSVYFVHNDDPGENFGEMDNTVGAPKWYRTFIQRLGEGDTVDQAIRAAYTEISKKPLVGVDENGIPYPSDYGLGSVYVAGDANQVVKH